MLLQFAVNPLAVLTAAAARVLIGIVWYSPLLFGGERPALPGAGPETAKKTRAGYLTDLPGALVSSYVMAIFINLSSAATVSHGALLGFLFWLGLVAACFAPPSRPGSRSLYLISAACHLVSFVVMGAILAVL